MRRPRVPGPGTLATLGALVAAILLAGCNTGGGGGATEGAAPLAEPSGQATARLTIRQRLVSDAILPTEGAIGFYRVRIAGSTDAPLEARTLPTVRRTEVLTRRLPPGDYVIEAFQRPCNVNCGNLAEPVDGCEREVTLEGSEEVLATVRVAFGSPCEIELS